MAMTGYRCGCSITTNNAGEVTGIGVCAAHYARVDMRALIAVQADQIRALHPADEAKPTARTLHEKLDAAIAAGDESAVQYYRGLLNLQQQADRAGPASGADAREILGKLDDIVDRMRKMAGRR